MSVLSNFSELDKGKKIKLVATVVLLVVVIWLLVSTFGGGDSNNTVTPVINKPVIAARPLITVRPAKIIQKKAIAVPKLNKKQKELVEATNDLQMLKLQEQIAQTKKSIISAQLAAAKSERNLNEIVNPAPPAPNYAKQLVKPANFVPSQSYKLLYLANEQGNWQVIIGDKGKLYNGTLGTVLPDGSKIAAVTANSVTLDRNGEEKVLSITPEV